MKYSVVLPRIDAKDPEGTRHGLERAAILWTKGEQREAIEHVRDAAAAATADGQTTRAVALVRAAARLSRAVGTSPSASTLPPTPEQAAPSVVPQTSDETELVVTVAPSNWDLPTHDALVGHRARRVAIAPGRGPGGTLMVRPLAAGEVAPRGSTVAVLVELDAEAPVVPRAQRNPSPG